MVDIEGSLHFLTEGCTGYISVDSVLEAYWDYEEVDFPLVCASGVTSIASIKPHQGTMRVSLTPDRKAYLTRDFFNWMYNA